VKRIRLVTALLAVGLLGIMAIGAGSASASVLCKRLDYPKCPSSDAYPVGTHLYFGATNVTLTESYGGPLLNCKSSGIVLTVTDAGGEWPYHEVKTSIDEWPFVECTNSLLGKVSNVHVSGSPTAVVNWNPGTVSGDLSITGEVLEFNLSQLGSNPCRFDITGSPTLLGPEQGKIASQLIFNKETAETLGTNNPCSGMKGFLSGTYNQLYFETPVYVSREY